MCRGASWGSVEGEAEGEGNKPDHTLDISSGKLKVTISLTMRVALILQMGRGRRLYRCADAFSFITNLMQKLIFIFILAERFAISELLVFTDAKAKVNLFYYKMRIILCILNFIFPPFNFFFFGSVTFL